MRLSIGPGSPPVPARPEYAALGWNTLRSGPHQHSRLQAGKVESLKAVCVAPTPRKPYELVPCCTDLISTQCPRRFSYCAQQAASQFDMAQTCFAFASVESGERVGSLSGKRNIDIPLRFRDRQQSKIPKLPKLPIQKLPLAKSVDAASAVRPLQFETIRSIYCPTQHNVE